MWWKDVILLDEVAESKFAADAPMPHVIESEVGACPNRDSAQIQNRCNPYSPTLGRLFCAREQG
jgi:hypothetical protein